MLCSKIVTGASASVTEHCTVATYGSTAGKQAPDGTYINVTVPFRALGTMWKNKPNHPQNWKTLQLAQTMAWEQELKALNPN